MSLLLLTIFTLGFCMVARRLSTTILTAPMIFIALGVLFAESRLLTSADAEASLHVVAEIALILLLFLDAAQIDLSRLRARHTWPLRMLVIGLPLAILLGTLAALPLLQGWPIFAVALVAAILAPTDAALGQAVVINPIVPERVRRALTVESGLNDGLALPAVLLFASLTAQEMGRGDTNWLLFGAMQLLLGPLAGIIIGLLGGKLLTAAQERELTSDIYEGIAAVALAGTAYLGADAIGGNGFIAAFVAGLCFGNVLKGRCKFVYEFTESDGQILTWAAFFLLGLALVPEAIAHLSWPVFALIMMSLFIARPLAIWLSLLGTDASPTTRLFFGWFGPRGLATALFALLVVQKIDHDFAKPVLMLAVNAVWISALLHGLSAVPGAKLYAAMIRQKGECPETEAIAESAKPLITRDHN